MTPKKTLKLEHFYVGKFFHGEYLRGAYSILGTSNGVSPEHIQKATRVDLFGREPDTNGEDLFYGFAFFKIDYRTFSLAMYQRSRITEVNRSFPIFKHYIIITIEELQDIKFEIDRLLNTLFFTPETNKIEKQVLLNPLDIEVQSINRSKISNLKNQKLLLGGLKTVLANPNGTFIFPESSPEHKVKLVSTWMQLIPSNVADLFTFTTTASSKLSNIRICFLDEGVRQASGEFNLLESNQLEGEGIGSSYLIWLNDALKSPGKLPIKLEKLRLPNPINEENLGGLLDHASQFYFWDMDKEMDPEIISVNKQKFEDLLTLDELKELNIRQAIIYFNNKNFPSFFRLLWVDRITFGGKSVITSLVMELPPSLSKDFIEIGLNDGRAQEITLNIIEESLKFSFSQNDEANCLMTINNLIKVAKTKYLDRVQNQFLNLPNDLFKDAVTVLLNAVGSYDAIIYLDENFNQHLNQKFPELFQLLKNINLYIKQEPDFIEQDPLEKFLSCFEGDMRVTWTVYCVEFITHEKCWPLLRNSDSAIQTAINSASQSSKYQKAWSRTWKIFSKNIQEFHGLNHDTWQRLAQWAIETEDCHIALLILGLMHLRTIPFAPSPIKKFFPLDEQFLANCKSENIISTPLEHLCDSEKWCWLYSSSLYLERQKPGIKSDRSLFLSINTFLELQLPIKSSSEIIENIIYPEGRLQIYIMLLGGLYRSQSGKSKSDKLESKLLDESLLMQMMTITIMSQECNNYLQQLREIFQKKEKSLNQYLKSLHRSALHTNLSDLEFIRRIKYIRENNLMISEAFALENAFLSRNVEPLTQYYDRALLFFLEDLLNVLIENPELTYFCQSWLPGVLNSEFYFRSLAELNNPIKTKLVLQSKEINKQLSNTKLKGFKRILKRTDIQLFDFTENMIFYLDYSEHEI